MNCPYTIAVNLLNLLSFRFSEKLAEQLNRR